MPVDQRYGQACNLESAARKGETEMLVAKLDVPMCFEMLYESDMWIGDSGASSHSTNNKAGTVNERQFGSVSWAHRRGCEGN